MNGLPATPDRAAIDRADAAAPPAAAAPLAAQRRPASSRLVAALLLAGSMALLGVAATLEPASAGYGTHESLGLPACGFKRFTALPCATCGMTTAFSHAANGNLIAAFSVQPAGTLLALLTAMTAVVAGAAMVFGFSLAPLAQSIANRRTVLTLGVALIGGWVYTLLLTVG